MDDVLVLGGDGELAQAFRRVGDTLNLSHRACDVTSRWEVSKALDSLSPRAVINCAAFRYLDACERWPEHAMDVNALGALNVAQEASRRDLRSVYISTDYVFGGDRDYTEDDPVSPLQVYGLSKASGEVAARMGDPNCLVVRTSGLFGFGGNNFVERMLAKSRDQSLAFEGSLSLPADVSFSPSCADDVAARVLELLALALYGAKEPIRGIYHVTNAGDASWYRFGRTFLPTAVPRTSGKEEIPRPRRSVLIDTKTPALGLSPMRDWEDALAWYLANR